MKIFIFEFLLVLIMLLITIVILLFKKYYEIYTKNKLNKHLTEKFSDQTSNICVLYAYYEKNELYKNNFIYFLENGLIDNIDYYIIINGDCSVEIPKSKNIKVYQRENKGYDFGAYGYAIKRIDKVYDYYFFINTSVKGPYLKDNSKKNWSMYFLELFNEENVKLVGTTINIYEKNSFAKYNLKEIYNKDAPFPHVQSMFFCIDSQYFNYLKEINFFDEEKLNDAKSINQIIAHHEFGLSQNAIKNGWNINSILPEYRNLDYRIITKDINETSHGGDPYYPKSYFGKTLDKYDVIFFKNNRF